MQIMESGSNGLEKLFKVVNYVIVWSKFHNKLLCCNFHQRYDDGLNCPAATSQNADYRHRNSGALFYPHAPRLALYP